MVNRKGLLATFLVIFVTKTCAITDEEIQIIRDRGRVNITIDDGMITFYSTCIPDHDYGPFPGIGNPNTVQEQDFMMTVPLNPTIADQPSCLNVGEIGMIHNGVPYFNPYNIQGENAVEGLGAEIFDSCNGHPQLHGQYHYHQIPNCVYEGKPDEFLGVSNDGFPIYGPLDENGVELKSEDLDVCHGRMHNGQYRYHMTYDYPYLQGCYKGTPGERPMLPPPEGGPPMGGNGPPMDGNGPPMDGNGPPMGECLYAIAVEPYEYTGEDIPEDLLNNDGPEEGSDADKVYGTLLFTIISLTSALLCLY